MALWIFAAVAVIVVAVVVYGLYGGKIQCRNCGFYVSRRETRCPNCGCDLKALHERDELDDPK